MRGGKHVKVKKRRRQDILRICADARKLILGVHRDPLDHLSVKEAEQAKVILADPEAFAAAAASATLAAAESKEEAPAAKEESEEESDDDMGLVSLTKASYLLHLDVKLV